LVAHLKLFDCDAFVHLPKERRRKLDKKEIKRIFIGYKEGMKGYKFWDPASRRKMCSRDAIFIDVGGKSECEDVVQIKNNPYMVCWAPIYWCKSEYINYQPGVCKTLMHTQNI
jgi:hypothetical protein